MLTKIIVLLGIYVYGYIAHREAAKRHEEEMRQYNKELRRGQWER